MNITKLYLWESPCLAFSRAGWNVEFGIHSGDHGVVVHGPSTAPAASLKELASPSTSPLEKTLALAPLRLPIILLPPPVNTTTDVVTVPVSTNTVRPTVVKITRLWEDLVQSRRF